MTLDYLIYRIEVPILPTWQDCHELWIKNRKRQMRENAYKICRVEIDTK